MSPLRLLNRKGERSWSKRSTTYDECGLRYAAIRHNLEVLALFRTNNTHPVAAKKRNKWKQHADEEAVPTSRDQLQQEENGLLNDLPPDL